ncbi:MAG: acyl-CoA dehydrogenase family protein [Alphaproteobacteria bacterium]
MDFNDTPEEAEFRAEVRAWLADNVPSDWRDRMVNGRFGEVCREWQKIKYDGGWACVNWPKEYGGRGLTPIQSVIWSQEESKVAPPSAAMLVVGLGMTGPMLMVHANDEQKARLLPKTASAEIVWCQLFSEPAGGSDLAALRTKAIPDGDEWVINGQKIWSSGAHESDWGILVTRTDPTVPKHKGLTFFVVDMKTPGIDPRPIKQISGQAHFNEVFLNDVRIPDANRIGAVGDGWKVAMTTLMNERLAVGSSGGAAGPAGNFDSLFEMVKDMEGEDGPLIGDPSVRERLADWYCREAGIRNVNARTVSALSRGDTPGPEASISKLIQGPQKQDMASFGMDLQDMAGALIDPEMAARRAEFQYSLLGSPAGRIAGGTDEIMRNIIAERVLGLPGDIRVDKDVPFSDIPTGT